MHHCWSCHLVTLAVKSGNPTAPAVKGHGVQVYKKNEKYRMCRNLECSHNTNFHTITGLSPPPHAAFFFFQASLQVVYRKPGKTRLGWRMNNAVLFFTG